MTKFWQVFQYQTTSEGGYGEGHSYLLYSAINYLPFMRAYNLFMDGEGGYYDGGTGSYWIPNFLSDSWVKAVHDWGVKIRMPNGTRPGFDDSYYIPFVSGLLASSKDAAGHATDRVPGTTTYHYAWDWYNFETLPQNGRQNFFSDYIVDLSVDIFCTFDATLSRRPAGWNPSQFMSEAGTAVFRHHWGKGSNYMLFLGENGNMVTKTFLGDIPLESHEHPDNTGIVLYSHGDLLALDSGYPNYGESWTTKKPENHSIVTIEGGLSTYVFNTVDGEIDHSFDTDFMDFAEVITYIKVGYKYEPWTSLSRVNYRRSVLFPNHRYFVMVDNMMPLNWGGSRTYHKYAWRLHGNGKSGSAPTSLEGAYTHLDGKGGVWTRTNGKLMAYVTTDRGTPGIANYSAPHALKWQEEKQPFDRHQVLKATKEVGSGDSNKNLRFLSVLYPTGAAEPLPVVSELNIQGATALKIEEPEEEGGMVGIALTKENWNNVVIPKGESGLEEIRTNGRICFVQFDPDTQRMNQLFVKNASSVTYGEKKVFSAANWIYHLALGMDENRLSGYLIFTGNHGQPYIDLNTGWSRFGVIGSTVSGWEALGGGFIRLWLSDSGRFEIHNLDTLPVLANHDFEEGLNYWQPYGSGDDYAPVMDGGSSVASISRKEANGGYFGLQQNDIPCKPNTRYRLTLAIKTELDSGFAAAGLGNWGSPNTHRDFGYTRGDTDWTLASGTWTSRADETSLRVILFGSEDFSGKAYFGDVVLENLGPVPLAVSISGPSYLGYKKPGTFTANVSKGTGSYTYQWYLKMDGSTNWYKKGTGKTQIATMIDKGFTLKAEVRDSVTGAKGSATKHVNYADDVVLR